MPQKPAYENSPPGKLFISGYDGKSLAYPVLEIHVDAKNPLMQVVPGQALKAFPASLGVACDVSNLYPNHILTELDTYAADQRQRLKYQIMPGPWEYQFSFDAQSRTFVFVRKRQNVAANIKPYLVQKNGSGLTLTATEAGGVVTGVAVGGAGAGYPDFFGVVFDNPGGSNPVTAQGYGTAVNGVPNAFFLTNPGEGYTGTPNVVALGDAVVEVRRIDTDTFLADEIVTIMQMTWQDLIEQAVHYDSIFHLDGIGGTYTYIDPIGADWEYIIGPRVRVVPVEVLNWISIGETLVPPASPVLASGATVQNPLVIWNPRLTTMRSYGGFSLNEAITDAYSENGIIQGVTFTVAVAVSNPSATDYVTFAAAGDKYCKGFQSVRMRGNLYANRAEYAPYLYT